MSFDYLLEKIDRAPFETAPFRHVQINDFFSPEHFREITAAPEIAVHGLNTDGELFDALFERGYKIINFPGCITNRSEYIKWHKSGARQQHLNNSACEGFGVTLRLLEPTSPLISELVAFLNSDVFHAHLAAKFGIEREQVYPDIGIQKYLDGYEISPHPDIRQKALTYMVNVNSGANSEEADHHTHYLKFREPFKYVQSYWEGNTDKNRCWVPWDWCESVKVQRENNSIVIFSPDNSSMHGVKARYDHLASQRTQLYGNLWYKSLPVSEGPEWEDLVLQRSARKDTSVLGSIKAMVPKSVKSFIRNRTIDRVDQNVVKDRLQSPL